MGRFSEDRTEREPNKKSERRKNRKKKGNQRGEERDFGGEKKNEEK